jgi:hypothetical protein
MLCLPGLHSVAFGSAFMTNHETGDRSEWSKKASFPNISNDHDLHEINNISTAGAGQPLRRSFGKGMEQTCQLFVSCSLYITWKLE